MRPVRRLWRRLRDTLRESSRDREFRGEVDLHIRMLTEDNVRAGMDRAEAHRAACLTFGSVESTKEQWRDQRRLPLMDTMARDVRFALRGMAREPGFAAVCVWTLALGIGATTAIFSVVNAVLLHPLGYPHPEQLRTLTTGSGDGGHGSLSPPEYLELTEISRSFSVVGAFVIGEVNLSAGDRPRRVTSATVNAGLLEALAVPAVRGRWFRREETRAGGSAPVILSDELWRSVFGGRDEWLGRTIQIDGINREVVGIMPAGFDLSDKRVELWLPLQLDFEALRPFRSSHFLAVLGRLKNGVFSEQAEAELASLVATWGERTGATGHIFIPGEHVLQMEPVLDEIVGPVRRAFWMLQAVAGLVLLIACVNLANLLVVRAEARRREIAVRIAIGASRMRLLAQFVTEGLALSTLGGALGLVLAWAGVRALTVVYPDSIPRVADVTVDPTVLGFALLVMVVTGVVFGLVPLSHLPTREYGSLLSDGTRGTTGGSRTWLRLALVGGEVALSVVLVAGAGLMVRTVVNLMNVDAGFDRVRLVTFAVALPAATYPTAEQRVQFFGRLMERVGASPGIDGVAAVAGLPPQREYNRLGTDIQDSIPTQEASNSVDYYQTVTGGYFETMGTPIMRGRPFQQSDQTGAPVAIVNEAFVRTFWKGLDPIGRRVRPRFGDQTPWVTVIGVAKDVKQAGIDQSTGTELYFLLDQLPQIFPTIPAARLARMLGNGSMHVMVRSRLAAPMLQPVIVNALRETDPSIPIIRLRNMDDVFRDSVRRPRMLMQLLTGFAGLALLLAAVGTYGVLSYLVKQRRREIGIRMALGAERRVVLRGVMGQGLRLTFTGLMAGLVGTLVLTRFMTTLLFEVRPNDPATLAGVAVLITAVTGAASLIPALRATRVDPIVALRDE